MESLGKDIIQMYKPYKVSPTQHYNQFVLNGEKFIVPDRYEVLQKIGKGSYGIVVAAKDLETKSLVAIKKIKIAFEHKVIAKRTLRQFKILRLLNEQFFHENIIKIQTILLPKSREQFNDIYVVSELMQTDLTQMIKKHKQNKQKIPEKHLQFLIYQLLRGLKFIHSCGIIHRDLKPRNLLVNYQPDLKICDFGLSRALTKNIYSEKKNDLTNYVITRWYRAPQLLLNSNEYTEAVDMWSVGCIFAQMISGEVFLKGKDTEHQLELIFQKVGVSEPQKINFISEENKSVLAKMFSYSKTKNLSKIFTNAEPEAVDLLQKLLKFNPDQRITVQQALNHPYLSMCHDNEQEPKGIALNSLDFEFQFHNNLTTQQFKDLIYQQILLYHNQKFRKDYLLKKKNNVSLIDHILKNSNSTKIDSKKDSDDF